VSGYKLFQKDRQGRRCGGVAREGFDVAELAAANGRVEFLWVRIKGRANRADVLVGVCYGLPNQDEETDEAFYKQLAEVA